MIKFIAYCAVASWITGMVITIISNASVIISQTNYERSGWKKYRNGYSIKEIREAIDHTSSLEIKERLKRKITLRKIGIRLLILTPILLIIQALISAFVK